MLKNAYVSVGGCCVVRCVSCRLFVYCFFVFGFCVFVCCFAVLRVIANFVSVKVCFMFCRFFAFASVICSFVLRCVCLRMWL